jgi:hypothetical protein
VTEPTRKSLPLGNTRREFAKALALAAAAPLVASPNTARADDPTPPAKPPGPLAAAEALTELARLQHGKHLTDEQLKAVQRSILGGVFAAERMNKVPLKNSDEPAFVFSADLP